jgi:PAS domain S-box-containing protein
LVLTAPQLFVRGVLPLWLPMTGLGLAAVIWLGWPGLAAAVAASFVVGFLLPRQGPLVLSPLTDSLLLGVEWFAAWWLYRVVCRGSRRVNDPPSATAFLLVVPGAVAVVAAVARAALAAADPFWQAVGYFWISDALGYLAVTPLLLETGTPWLSRAGVLGPSRPEERVAVDPSEHRSWGDLVEMLGLGVGAGILSLLLTENYLAARVVNWQLWAILLLVVVWSSLRQGLSGGTLAAALACVTALVIAAGSSAGPAHFMSLQGHLLALGSTALLVGASSGWIRASELRYRQVVGHIPVVLYSARVTSRPRRGTPLAAEVVLVSPGARQLFGCPPQELVGEFDVWLGRVHPDDRELVTAALAQLSRRRGTIRSEYRLNPDLLPPDEGQETPRDLGAPVPASAARQQRRERWVRDTLAPNYDRDGNLLGWEGVVEDITTQRQLARDLQRTSTMLHTLVANLPAGVFFVQGAMGLPLLVNNRARQLLGQREDLSAGLTHLPRIYRLHRPDGTLYPWEELPVYKALHLGTTSMKDDIVIHRPDGRQVPLVTWAAPIDLGGGGTEAAVWVFEDLTSLQQAEAARLDSESRLRTIIENMAEGLVIEDQDGVIIECNPAACMILGVTPEQLLARVGLAPSEGCLREDGSPFPPSQYPDVVAVKSRQTVRNVVLGIPAPQPGPDGNVRWVVVNCVPITTGQTGRPGFLNRTLVTFTDITASRRMVSDLERVQRLEVAARMASGFVHDFNNLLTAILALAQMAQMKLQPNHPLIPDLETIQAAAEEAGRLAGQLLAFSRHRKASHRPVDLNQAVHRAMQVLQSSLPATIEVDLHLPAAPVMVLADDGQLQQIVMNLCLNARDAMPRGGRLTVQTSIEPIYVSNANDLPAPAPGQTSRGRGWARLSVRDTGEGIDRNIQAKVFDPFFSTKDRGTGLGLAVVRHLVDSFHGRIELWSQPGQGTRFDIWLPVHIPDNGNGAKDSR